MSVLTTPRLVLSPIGADDGAALQEHWSHPEVQRYLFDGEPVTPALIAEIVGDSETDFARHGYGLWAIRDGERIVGVCGLRAADDGRIEMLYSLDPHLWGRGLATEAGRAVLDHAVALGVPEVVAEADTGNAASLRLAVRLGMRRLETRNNDTLVRFITP